MLRKRCPVCLVSDVGVLWPKGHIVLHRDPVPPQKRPQPKPPIFGPDVSAPARTAGPILSEVRDHGVCRRLIRVLSRRPSRRRSGVTLPPPNAIRKSRGGVSHRKAASNWSVIYRNNSVRLCNNNNVKLEPKFVKWREDAAELTIYQKCSNSQMSQCTEQPLGLRCHLHGRGVDSCHRAQVARRQIGGDEMTTRRVVWLVWNLAR